MPLGSNGSGKFMSLVEVGHLQTVDLLVLYVMYQIPCNVGKTIVNHPFGNGLYHLFMVIWGIVYGIVLHHYIIFLATLHHVTLHHFRLPGMWTK